MSIEILTQHSSKAPPDPIETSNLNRFDSERSAVYKLTPFSSYSLNSNWVPLLCRPRLFIMGCLHSVSLDAFARSKFDKPTIRSATMLILIDKITFCYWFRYSPIRKRNYLSFRPQPLMSMTRRRRHFTQGLLSRHIGNHTRLHSAAEYVMSYWEILHSVSHVGN